MFDDNIGAGNTQERANDIYFKDISMSEFINENTILSCKTSSESPNIFIEGEQRKIEIPKYFPRVTVGYGGDDTDSGSPNDPYLTLERAFEDCRSE